MKTTIDIDDKKLRRLMRLTGLKTRKETVDFALTEAERFARIQKLLAGEFYVTAEEADIVDPNYDIVKNREREKPDHAAH